ncbi:4-oxalocrotonate tautomerase family protein [Streptacidiphilus sp. 4-A2]|nr:4-oxalocrotonate tautomerase family protein [Streptacidiphilus sp. 4-A2]
MPIVTIKVGAEGVTREQKAKLCEGVTAVVHEVLAKDPERVYVLVDEIPVDNWSAGSELLSARRARGFNGICDCGEHEEFLAEREARLKAAAQDAE